MASNNKDVDGSMATNPSATPNTNQYLESLNDPSKL